MNTSKLVLKLVRDSRELCLACVVLPCLAFALGVAAVYYPVPILTLSIAAAGLGWIAFYRLLAAPRGKTLSGRIAATLTFGAMSIAQAFSTGMLVAGPGNYDGLAMLFAFGFGLLAAISYRKHHAELRRGVVGVARA